MHGRLNDKSLTLFSRAMIFTCVAIIGFAYVKWVPYYAKAFLAQSHHSIGDSIISGKAGSAPDASWSAAVDYAISYGKAIWKAMVLGLILGSGIKVLLPARWVSAALGRLGFRSTLLGGLFAIPCMMCTCCAAPVVAGMRQSRASIGSAVSWWISNPVLNPATLVFMGFVLGWNWALFRVVFGIAMVLGIAYLAERYADPSEPGSLAQDLTIEVVAPTDSFLVRWGQEFMALAIRLLPEYLVLVLLLGAARTWLFPVLGAHDSLGWIVAMALAGTLFVIPTAGEIPIVQGMFALGMGVGPAAALIMTLPAVSLPSLAMLGSVFSLRVRLVIASAVVLSGIVAGLVAMRLF
ncbi:putative permease [mine drainage metagenome]|uniref:Putative permease n=1 Tax=mine drainage metagenome TaxID=410659 RepID=A0A1J5QAN0_9ZZZZ